MSSTWVDEIYVSREPKWQSHSSLLANGSYSIHSCKFSENLNPNQELTIGLLWSKKFTLLLLDCRQEHPRQGGMEILSTKMEAGGREQRTNLLGGPAVVGIQMLLRFYKPES